MVPVTSDCFQMTPCGDSFMSPIKTHIWLKAEKYQVHFLLIALHLYGLEMIRGTVNR